MLVNKEYKNNVEIEKKQISLALFQQNRVINKCYQCDTLLGDTK